MARYVADELEALMRVLGAYPEGLRLEEIADRSGLGLERRTLQRRLLTLKQRGQLSVKGKGRATRYVCLPTEDNEASPSHQRSAAMASANKPDLTLAASVLPLSEAGRAIQVQVTQPLQRRTPVGYQRAFLDAYIPNVDSYLSEAMLARLAELGKTGIPDQPAGTYAKDILSRLLIDLSWNSSRLEGNTYSLLDTQRLLTFGETADDKTTAEAQMILNHKDAIEFLLQPADEIGFNPYTILNLHALLSNNLLPDPSASGRLRTFGVGIHQSVFEPLAVPQMIVEMFELMLEKAHRIQNPFEQAFFVMVHLPYLQPFDDVNKRVSRLAANIPLSRHNLAPLSFVDVPDDIYVQGIIGVYELNRVELLRDVFLWAYERSAARYAALRQSLGEPDPFRLQYREAIRDLVGQIVTEALPPKDASRKIKAFADALPAQDQGKFIESVDTELLSLHEGNFARYRIRPSAFKHWQAIWSSA